MLGLAKRVGARLGISLFLLFLNLLLIIKLLVSVDLRDCNFHRILLTSTSEVYGDPLVHPQPESYWGNVNPIGTYLFLWHAKPDSLI
jgi:hypothetical protein